MNTTKKEVSAQDVAEFLAHLDYPDAEEVADAYLVMGVTSSEDAHEIANEIEDAYSGTFTNDEEFARDMHDQTTSLNTKENQAWPYYCIDWEWAARELMMDYSEENGHYFRNV